MVGERLHVQYCLAYITSQHCRVFEISHRPCLQGVITQKNIRFSSDVKTSDLTISSLDKPLVTELNGPFPMRSSYWNKTIRSHFNIIPMVCCPASCHYLSNILQISSSKKCNSYLSWISSFSQMVFYSIDNRSPISYIGKIPPSSTSGPVSLKSYLTCFSSLWSSSYTSTKNRVRECVEIISTHPYTPASRGV